MSDFKAVENPVPVRELLEPKKEEPVEKTTKLIEPLVEKKKQNTQKTSDNKFTITPAKVGISVAASLAVGSAAWFGLQNKNITILGALGALALGFVVQKN